jgi:hypothetical protein
LWVEAELGAMVPGIVQSNVFQWNIRLVRYNKAGNNMRRPSNFLSKCNNRGIILAV